MGYSHAAGAVALAQSTCALCSDSDVPDSLDIVACQRCTRELSTIADEHRTEAIAHMETLGLGFLLCGTGR